jgi:hypothetical protein
MAANNRLRGPALRSWLRAAGAVRRCALAAFVWPQYAAAQVHR